MAEFCTQIYTDLERLFYLLNLLNLREIMLPGRREPPRSPLKRGRLRVAVGPAARLLDNLGCTRHSSNKFGSALVGTRFGLRPASPARGN